MVQVALVVLAHQILIIQQNVKALIMLANLLVNIAPW